MSATTSALTTFIALADTEYDALSEYCNSLSLLSHAIHESHKPKSFNSNSTHDLSMGTTSSSRTHSVGGYSATLTKNKEEQALLGYTRALRTLQKCHSKLIQCKHSYYESTTTTHDNEINADNKILHEDIKHFIMKHLELSSRVLRTCASSDTKGYGPLHENGILKNLTGAAAHGGEMDIDWHEARLVSLVSLRASIERLKEFSVSLEQN